MCAAGENFMIFTLKMLHLSASQFFLRQIFGSQKLQGGASSPLSPPWLRPWGGPFFPSVLGGGGRFFPSDLGGGGRFFPGVSARSAVKRVTNTYKRYA